MLFSDFVIYLQATNTRLINNMCLVLGIVSFLYSVLGLALSIPSKSLVITERRTSNYDSKIITCESDFSHADMDYLEHMIWTGPDGQRIYYKPTENIFSIQEGNKSSLIAHDVSKDQEGPYTCHKFENGTYYRESYHLEKTAKPPEFDTKFENITVEVGSDVEILCLSKGDNNTYRWYSDVGMEIVENEGKMFIKNLEDGLMLTIKNVTLDLKGMYACNAQNSHGLVFKIHSLNVVETQKNQGYAVFEHSSLNISEYAGQAVINVIRLGGSQGELHVLWKALDYTKENFRSYIPNSGHLDFQDGQTQTSIQFPIYQDDVSEPNEIFVVRLYNDTEKNVVRNGTEIRVTIVDDDVIAYVENSVPLEVTENSIHFFLKIANTTTTGDLQIFVKFRETSSNNETSIVWKPGDKHEISNLIASWMYEFSFRVEQYGKWSEKYRVVLLPTVPDIILESFGSGTLALRFCTVACDKRRENIDKHRITYTEIQFRVDPSNGKVWIHSKCNISVEISDCLRNNYVITGLHNYKYYEIQVEAYTSAGYGKPFKQKIQVQP